MPVPATTANAALSIVNGLVRLTGRIDRIMAEQHALRSDLAFAGKVVVKPPPGTKIKKALADYLDDTEGQVPDPLGNRRQELVDLLASNPTRDKLMDWAETFVPDRIVYKVDDPNGDFARKLSSRRGTWDLDDDDVARLAYYLDPDKDLREGKLAWQLAMSVVEVVADVAVQNQQLIFRDDRARPIVMAVLERFASVDLVNSGPNRIFLRTVLHATLNGALDAAETLDADKAWVDAIVSALATTREESGRGDDFVVGLVQGRGYNLLIANLLEEGSDHLSGDRASDFESVAADVLVSAAQIIEREPGFEDFFRDHWGDLLRAGLRSVHINGNRILNDAEPLLKQTLLATLDVLAQSEDNRFLSSDTLVDVVDAAIGAVAIDPNILGGGDDWLETLLTSTVAAVSAQGVRETFTDDGVDFLLKSALTEFAARPELLIRSPGLPRDVVGSVLSSLADTGKLRLEVVAESAVQGVLTGIAARPELAGTNYPALVAEVAGALAARLDDLALSREEAGDILADVARAIAGDSTLVGIAPDTLRAQVLDGVLDELLRQRGKRLGSSSVRRIVAALLRLAATNAELLADQPALLRKAVAPMLDTLAGQVGDGSGEIDLRLDIVLGSGLVGLLDAVERNPLLLDSRFPQAAAALAATFKDLLDDGRLSDGQLETLAEVAIDSLAANLELLVDEHDDLAAEVMTATIAVLLADQPLRLDRETITTLLSEVLVIVSAHGRALLGGDPVETLARRIAVVIDVGLDKAAAEIGQLLDRNAVAYTVVLLLRRWAADDVPTLDVNDVVFEQIFAEIALEAVERLR